MGKRGPLPLPDNVRTLRGLKPARQAHGRPQARAPKMPDHLGPEARKEWRRIVPILLEHRQLTELDRAQLTLYCQAWQTAVLCDRRLAAEMDKAIAAGGDATDAFTEISQRSGMARRGMLLQIAEQARRECALHLEKLGMSPVARARLPAPSGQLELPGLGDASSFADL